MAETHVISALTAKRSELAGLAEFHQKEINRITEEVRVLDSAIKLFEPDYRIQSIRPKRYQRKNEFFKHGEAQKLLLDIIRQSDKPISTITIAEEAIRRKGLELDKKQFSAFKSTIGGALIRYRSAGIIVETSKDKGISIWDIAK
ncbi:hypothetical protein [Methylomonas sp. TEB]|uniref:hypothetical protein n=1 Tax=Methylomonas sp. TEB TaxID=3398229 RepID=UPI0039F5FB24